MIAQTVFELCSSKRAFESTRSATFGCWTTCTCHIAWRALPQTRRAGGGRKTTPHQTWPPCSPDLNPLDFHLWQEWETALGERQFQSQLAMIVRTLSALDPEAAEKAFRRCLACVPKAAISSTACDGPAHMHVFFFLISFRPVLKHGPKSLTVEQVFFLRVLSLQAP